MRQTSEETKRKNAARAKEWREKNPDYMKGYMKEYRQDHSEEMKEADRKYHADHRDERNAARRKWREENPEKQAIACRRWYEENEDRVRDTRFKAKYGISLLEYDLMLIEQNGKCKICFTSEPKGMGRFHVDHSHQTGKVRGLLCHSCNTGLGHFKEKAALLRVAASYLETEGMTTSHS